MRIAFCFSGQIRNIDECINYWKPIVEKYNSDVYASFWDTDLEYKDKFIEAFNPEKIEFEDFNIFKKTTLDIFTEEINPPMWVGPQGLNLESGEYVKKGNMLSMFYKIWKCNILSSHKKYDIIVRLRTDIFLSNFDIQLNNYLNIPHGLIGIWHWENCYGPVDCIAYSNQEIMNYYASTYLYLTRYLKEGEYFFPAENILRLHLSNKEINIRNFISYVYFFRSKSVLEKLDHYNSHNVSFVEEKIFSSLEWSNMKPNKLFNFWKNR